MRKSAIAASAVVVAIGFPVYWVVYFLFGPWEFIPKVTARATSPDGTFRAEVYRKGFGMSWQAYCRLSYMDGALIFDQLIDGLDTIDEIPLYFSELRFEDDSLLIGPHASHQTKIIDYYRIPFTKQYPRFERVRQSPQL